MIVGYKWLWYTEQKVRKRFKCHGCISWLELYDHLSMTNSDIEIILRLLMQFLLYDQLPSMMKVYERNSESGKRNKYIVLSSENLRMKEKL